MEDFDAGGERARHWIPMIWCMLAAGALKAPAHQSLQRVFASTLFPADKKTSLKHPTISSILITALMLGERGRGCSGGEGGGGAAWPDWHIFITPPTQSCLFGNWLFLNFIFEFNKHGNLNRLIRFCSSVPSCVIKIGSNWFFSFLLCMKAPSKKKKKKVSILQ